jgi:hypothetical protein
MHLFKEKSQKLMLCEAAPGRPVLYPAILPGRFSEKHPPARRF